MLMMPQTEEDLLIGLKTIKKRLAGDNMQSEYMNMVEAEVMKRKGYLMVSPSHWEG